MIKPLVWMRAVRDADPPFTPARLLALMCLALRMNPDGAGFASGKQLATDANTSESTVRCATADARRRGYLEQTRRGHRLGNGGTVASEWRLSQPPTNNLLSETQPPTGERLSESQPPNEESQPPRDDFSTADPSAPQRSSPRGLSSRVRAVADAHALDSDKPAEPVRVNGLGNRHRFNDDPWNIGYCQTCKLPPQHPRHYNPRNQWMREV